MLETKEKVEDKNISGGGDIFVDISSSLFNNPFVTKAALIAELEAKVSHYRDRVEEYRHKLRVWESALKSALEENSESNFSKRAKADEKTEGVADRAFVRVILKRYKTSGVTPAQILAAAREDRRAIPHNFPYTILHRFKTQSRPEVRKENGRYFPIGENGET